MRSALLFYRNGGFELWDWQFLSNPAYLTRPCMACGLETSSRSSLLEAEVEVRQETILRRELEGMQGKGEDLARAGRERAAMPEVVEVVVVTVVEAVVVELTRELQETVEMQEKSK